MAFSANPQEMPLGLSAAHEDAAKAIGLKLRQRRREAGLTLRQIGEAVGVSFVQVQRFEAGTSPLSIARLLAICELLQIAPASLFNAQAETVPAPEQAPDADWNELSRLFATVTEPRDRQVILQLARAAATGTEMFYHDEDHSPQKSLNPKFRHEGLPQ